MSSDLSRRQFFQLTVFGGVAAMTGGCNFLYDDYQGDGTEENGTAYDIDSEIIGQTQYDVLREAYPEGRPSGDLQFKVRRDGSWADPSEAEFEIDEDDAGDGMWLYRFGPQDQAVLFMIVEDESESNA